MTRLTNTQRIILSAASQREDRGVELPFLGTPRGDLRKLADEDHFSG